MNNWTDKLESDTPLTQEEEALLEQELASEEQTAVAAQLRAMAQLHPQTRIDLAFSQKINRVRRLRLTTAFSAAAAACLVAIAVLRQPDAQPIAQPATAAESLYNWHYEAVATSVQPGDSAGMAGLSQIAGGGAEAQ